MVLAAVATWSKVAPAIAVDGTCECLEAFNEEGECVKEWSLVVGSCCKRNAKSNFILER